MSNIIGYFDGIAVIGAGLAGSELAWQLAKAGERVLLIDMRPVKKSAAHQSDACAELVCSNSFRSKNPENAVGLIKEEMEQMGSLIMEAARHAHVPAGDALAVDRGRFAAYVTEKLASVPQIEKMTAEVLGFERDENGVKIYLDKHEQAADPDASQARGPTGSMKQLVPSVPDHPQGREASGLVAKHVICATGPLTSSPLHQFLQTLFSRESLYFYDSIAPIIATESIDRDKVYAASRYGKGESDAARAAYLNCPLNKEEYDQFIDALLAAEKVPINEIDKPIFFEACLPIEVMAERGRETLRFGPMKPVGLDDPKTGRWPYAVVQLRLENAEGTCYNLVGFQTRLKHGEQKRVFSLIPGLEKAEFLRFGAMHRNTYLNSPHVLTDRLECPEIPGLYFAGQITGVEGYVESAAVGLLLGKLLPRWTQGKLAALPPPTTAFGALYRHLRESTVSYQPNNVHFGLFSALPGQVHKKDRKATLVARARDEFRAWLKSIEMM